MDGAHLDVPSDLAEVLRNALSGSKGVYGHYPIRKLFLSRGPRCVESEIRPLTLARKGTAIRSGSDLDLRIIRSGNDLRSD